MILEESLVGSPLVQIVWQRLQDFLPLVEAGIDILPLYHKSGLLGLYAALTVSDLFFVVFVEFYGVF